MKKNGTAAPRREILRFIFGSPTLILIVRKTVIAAPKPVILRRGQILTLGPLNGERLITPETFPAGIDRNFAEWGLNKSGVPTLEMPVQVNEIESSGTLMGMFSAVYGPWCQKWVSRHQYIEFCEKFPDWLHGDGSATFFLIKKDERQPIDEANPQGNMDVAYTCVYEKGLYAYVRHLNDGEVWEPEYLRRLVVPVHLAA